MTLRRKWGQPDQRQEGPAPGGGGAWGPGPQIPEGHLLTTEPLTPPQARIFYWGGVRGVESLTLPHGCSSLALLANWVQLPRDPSPPSSLPPPLFAHKSASGSNLPNIRGPHGGCGHMGFLADTLRVSERVTVGTGRLAPCLHGVMVSDLRSLLSLLPLF